MGQISRRVWVVGLVCVGLFLYWGLGRWPTSRAEGGPVIPPTTAGVAASAPTRLKIASFNIQSGVGMDERYDLSRTANLLKGYDLVALQEVSGGTPWTGNQAKQLASLLGASGLFAPTETRFAFPVFGNGFLTRTRVDRWVKTPLPNGHHMAHRNMVQLAIPFGQKTLNVIIVHTGKKSDRARHFDVAMTAFKSLPEPAILMGDMNTRPEDAMMVRALQCGTIRDVVGERIPPVDRVDFILTRGVKCVDAGRVATDASDHPLVWAEIEAEQ